MSKKRRKPSPQPPRWAWLDLDGCWFCKNRNNCGRCKTMKQYKNIQQERQNRQNKKNLFDFYKNF